MLLLVSDTGAKLFKLPKRIDSRICDENDGEILKDNSGIFGLELLNSFNILDRIPTEIDLFY